MISRPLGNTVLDFLEHFRGKFHYPLKYGSGGAYKNIIGEFIQPVQGGADGGFRFGTAFLPLPDGISVGVAHQIIGGFLLCGRAQPFL